MKVTHQSAEVYDFHQNTCGPHSAGAPLDERNPEKENVESWAEVRKRIEAEEARMEQGTEPVDV